MSRIKQAQDIKDDLFQLAKSIEILVSAIQTDGAKNEPDVSSEAVKQSEVIKRAVEEIEAMTTTAVEEISIERIRAVLAAKSKAGMREAVKALIDKCGVDKLTDVPKTMYTQLLAEAEAI